MKTANEPATVKCVVWDLDNTLWDGTLLEGDDVQVTPAARKLLELLDSRGILQAVASKNDHDHAWAKLEQLGVAEYFVAARIGWSVKSESIRQIAEELRFAESTIAFIDDQPAERAEVQYHLPQVRCYDATEVPGLGSLADLTPAVVTADARNRRGMYQAAARRETAREGHVGPDADFVRSLDLVMQIEQATEEHLHRVEELTLRTSQMNATGIHYSHETLRDLLDDPAHRVLVVSMADRFGPHGAVGVVLMETLGPVWHLKLLATSCRVVAFGAGAVLLRWLDDQAARAGVHILADFRRNDRNRMMEIAYRFSGFTDDDCACRSALVPAADGLQRLHLITSRQPAPDTMTLEVPALAGI